MQLNHAAPSNPVVVAGERHGTGPTWESRTVPQVLPPEYEYTAAMSVESSAVKLLESKPQEPLPWQQVLCAMWVHWPYPAELGQFAAV